jgi:hypothetical protein
VAVVSDALDAPPRSPQVWVPIAPGLDFFASATAALVSPVAGLLPHARIQHHLSPSIVEFHELRCAATPSPQTVQGRQTGVGRRWRGAVVGPG